MKNIETRIQVLEAGTPGGYRTFDGDGNIVIDSTLPALEWMQAADALLRSPGREAEKEVLRAQLAASEGRDGGGGLLYQLVWATDPIHYVPKTVLEKEQETAEGKEPDAGSGEIP